MRTTLVLAAALLTAGHALSAARANEAPAAPVVQSVEVGGPVESRGDNIQSRGGTAVPVDTYNRQVDELPVGPCDEGACDTPPRLVQGAAPVYPPAAVLAEIEGSASILFDLDADGRVVNAVVEEATHPAMGESALAALAQWQFEPARLQGRPVPLRQLRQSFPFQLVGPAVPPASPDDWG
ncbi:energy transducer TonB, partial [Bacillus sp. OA1]|nr:energy transducer TonB [Bacillus sp. OA1]